MMDWIYLSPHFDDVAFSCGGLVWQQAEAGHSVSVWTICAGEPRPGPLSPFAELLHSRWGAQQAVPLRREEDFRSSRVMKANARHFPIPDCIYRGSDEPFYPSENALFGPLHPAEESLVQDLVKELSGSIPGQANLVCPLALGSHVDHQLTRAAAEGLGRPLWYYADYPYVLKYSAALEQLEQTGFQPVEARITEPGVRAWQAAAAAHASQISTFWAGPEELRDAIAAYAHKDGEFRLWRRV